MPNALKELNRYGQSVWLDYIRRSLITSGELRRLLDEDGLRGVTSNPAIFEKAIAGSTDYEGQLKEFAKRKELDAKGAYEIDRKSTRLNSSHGYISYAVFCLKKKKKHILTTLGKYQ